MILNQKGNSVSAFIISLVIRKEQYSKIINTFNISLLIVFNNTLRVKPPHFCTQIKHLMRYLPSESFPLHHKRGNVT